MNMMSRHFRANSALLVFLSIVLANKPSLAGVAADFPRDSIALANVNFSYFISKGNGERKLTSSVSEIGKFLFGTVGSASGLVVLGQCSQSLKGMQSFKYHHSVTDVLNRKNEANNYSLSSASSMSKSNFQSAAVAAQEPKMLSIPSSEITSDTVATQSPKTTRATSSAPLAALLQSQRLQNCGPNFWPAPEGEPWVALLPSYGTLESVRAAVQLNASAVLIYNATFNDQSLFRNDTRAVVVAVSPSVGAEVALRLRQGALVYVSLHKTHHNYPATVNRTSVLFVSVSFILLMIVSLAWLVFYYVQRFRYINAKDRLQRHLSNAAKKALSKIPVKNIKLGDRELALEDSCAVCLEAYTAGDTVRVLPCRHEFHKACVDPWLLDHRTCPMCKMDILRHYGYNLSDSSDSVGNGIIDDDPNIGANNVTNVLTQSLPRAYVSNNNNSGNSGNLHTQQPVVRTDAADTAPGTPATSTEAEARDEPDATLAVLSAPPLASPEDASSEASPPCTTTHRPPGFAQALDSPAPDAGVEAPTSTVVSSAHPTSANATAKPESFLRAMLDTARSRVPFSARGFGKLTLEEGKLVDETGGAIREDPRELEASVNQENISSAANASVSSRADGVFGNDYSSVEDDSSRSSPVLSLHTPRQAETHQDLCDVDSLDSHEFTDALEHMTPRVIVRSAKSKHPVVEGEEPNSALRNSKVSPPTHDQANIKYFKGNKTGNFKRSAPNTISDVPDETRGKNDDARLSGNVAEAFAGNSHFPVNGMEQGSGVRQDNGMPVVKEDRKDGLTLNVLEIPSSPSNTSLFRDVPEPKRRCVTADVRKKSSTSRAEELPGVHKRTTSEDPDSLALQGLEGSLEVDRNARGYFQLSEVEENDPTLRDMRPRVSAVARSFTPLSSSRQDDRSKSEKRNNVCSVRSSRSIPGLSSYAIPGAVAAVGIPISRKKSEPELNTDVRLRDLQQHDGARQQSSAQKYPTGDGAIESATNTTELPPKSAAANRVAVKPAINLLPNDMLNSRRKSPVAPSAVDPYCSHKTDLEDLKRRLTILSDQMPLSPEFLPEASTTTSKSRYDLSRMGARRSSGFDTETVPHVRNMVPVPTLDTSSRKVSKAGKEAMPRIPSHAISSNFSQKDDRPMTNLSESRQREVEMARRRSRKVAPVPGVPNGDSGGSSLQAKSSARPFSVKEKPNSKEELGQPTQSNKNVFSVSYA